MSIRLARLLLLLALAGLWEAYARLWGDRAFVAAPSEILAALGPKIFANPKVVSAILLTLFELATAFALSVICGVAAGILIGASDLGRRSFLPLVLMLYGIPQVVVLPLFVLVFGLGAPSKIAFGFTHGIFPILVNTIAGMRNVDAKLVQGTVALGARPVDIARHVLLPHMVPAIFTGLRLAMTMTLLGVLLAELYVSTAGIGYFTQLYADTSAAAPLYALIAVLALMAVGLNEMMRLLEARFTRWRH